MVFWSGHGILIPIFMVLGAVVGGFLLGVVSGFLGYNFGMATMLVAAAAAVFLYGRTIGSSRPHPKTGERRSHTLYFLPPNVWSVALLVWAGFALMEESNSNPGFKMETSDAAQPTPPYRKAFDAADSEILSAEEGIAYGNTEDAQNYALAFAEAAKEFRNVGIEKADSVGLSLTDGEMVTYCRQSDESLVFMVHVPKLRKFTDGAKDFMMEAAWVSAQLVASQIDPAPENLAVGVRGVVFYDQGWSGTVTGDIADDPFSGVSNKLDDSEAIQAMLARFFRKQESKQGDRPTDDTGAEMPKGEGSMPQAEAPAEIADESSVPSPTESEVDPQPTSPSKAAPAVEATPVETTLPSPVRKWQSAEGGEFTGSLQRFLDETFEKAEFKDAEGKVFNIPLSRFANEDREQLRAYFDAWQAGQ